MKLRIDYPGKGMTRAYTTVGRFLVESFRFEGLPQKAARSWSATPVDTTDKPKAKRDAISMLTFEQAVAWATEHSR